MAWWPKRPMTRQGSRPNSAYTKVTSCTEKCTWLEESNERSIYGQILSQTSLGFEPAVQL